jgi:hypothetical protein
VTALALAVLGGCGVDMTTAGDESLSTGAPSSQSAMKLLFEDHFSDTGAIKVFESDEGLVTQIEGKIGQDDPVAIGEIYALPSLESVYLALHRDATRAPDALLAIDRRIAADKASTADRVMARARAQAATASPLIEKDLAQYKSTVCKTFWSTSYNRYTPAPCPSCIYTESNVALDCNFHANVHAISQYTGGMYSGDRAYVWNQGPAWGTVRQRDRYNVTHGGTVRIQPWNWSWVSWSYSNDYNAVLELDAGGFGDLGITFHQHTYIIK